MKRWKLILLIVAVLLLVAQLIRPSMTNPPVNPAQTLQATTSVPPAVTQILDRSCRDCHSSNTSWPWYSKVAPMSWLLADHVSEGRKELSFSEWATYAPRKKARKLQEVDEQVREGEMPLKSYLPLHPEAKLSDADRQTLSAWALAERQRMIATGEVKPEDLKPRPKS